MADAQTSERTGPPSGEPTSGAVERLTAEVERLRSEIDELRSGRVGRPRDETPRRSRRALIGAAGASALGLAVGAGRPAAAADPDDVVKNISNPVTDTTTLDGSFPGPTLSLFNGDTSSNTSALYAKSDEASPTVRADNENASGIGGVGLAGNAPGGRDLHASGSGRIAMTSHDFGGTNVYTEGEIHQSGGSVYAMVTPSVRREIVGPTAAGALHLVEPTRIYDSRRPEPQFGRLQPGESRVISVAEGRSVASGAVTVPDLVVFGATAVVFNITVTETVGPGFLLVAPASSTGETASTINWTDDGTTIANSSMVGLSGDRQIRVTCAPSASTHVIIDILGYHA